MDSTPNEALPVRDVVVATRKVPMIERSCRRYRRSRSTRGVVLGDDLAVVRAGKRLDTALEHADQNRQNPELHGRLQEERGEEHDAHVCHDRRRDHRLAAESRRQTAVENRAGEGHELRDEQCHHQLVESMPSSAP